MDEEHAAMRSASLMDRTQLARVTLGRGAERTP
jgi:hypothetical protein